MSALQSDPESYVRGLTLSDDDVNEARVSERVPVDGAGRGAQALAQLRVATAGICDVIPLTAEDDFHVTSATMIVGNALLVDAQPESSGRGCTIDGPHPFFCPDISTTLRQRSVSVASIVANSMALP